MLHTFRIVFDIEQKHVRYLKDAYDINYLEVGKALNSITGVSITTSAPPGGMIASMIVDVPLLIGKGNVTILDKPIVMERLCNIIGSIFGDRSLYNKHRLMRIDYRYDVIIEKEELRIAFIKLFRKSLRRKGKLLKKLGRINIQGEFERYCTGIEHTNDSVETAIYDKMAERKKRKKRIMDYEKNVLRFELRMKKGFLYDRERRHNVPRTLDSYFCIKRYSELMGNYIIEIYLTENFYRFDNAVKIIENSEYTLRTKKSLKTFLGTASRGDLSSAQRSISPATFNNRLASCKGLNIHPITIPNRWKHVPDVLENPLNNLAMNIKKNL